MIGLGSNRLTVCRRGGMSVTQAGRGGMEWLAGGRMPSWASPYSRQATAALLAQFPTQWPTIRDYGFAHPEIVGYMNAYAPEDAKIAYSLVEGIGTRWLVGDGTGYFKTGIITTKDSVLEFKARSNLNNSGYTHIVGGQRTYSGDYGGFDFYRTNSSYGISSNSVITLGTWVNGTIYAVRYSLTKIYVNDVLKGSYSITPIDGTYELWFFWINRSNSGTENKFKGECDCLKVSKAQDGKDHWLVPFKRNGQMELLDLVSGNLATRVGTFTELIETPAS